ncbi:MAG: 3-hydroxyacyl-ACP dehydratase FabZ [Lentisphaerae bacterium]|nr:3-hydroxyacyl-ACP dehydratase FabZ [Lentisphaerota bacterium]
MNDAPSVRLDYQQLRKMLPQQAPFMMVDRVWFPAPQQARGIKNMTINEPFFQGHFPAQPVLPGVLLLEALLQVGGVLMHQSAGWPWAQIWLLAIEQAKFRQPVVPGDQLELDLTVLRCRGGSARLRGLASVRGTPVGQAVFTLGQHEALRPRHQQSAPATLPAPQTPPFMDIQQIMRIIPHRYPFLMIDAILCQTAEQIVALKNLSGNEPFFQGPLPQNAVMPGTLLMEAMAQAGSVHMLNMPHFRGQVGYFMSLEQARFRQPVRPGDQLILTMELTANRRRVGRGYGCAFVDGVQVAEARLAFIIAEAPPAQAAAEQAPQR